MSAILQTREISPNSDKLILTFKNGNAKFKLTTTITEAEPLDEWPQNKEYLMEEPFLDESKEMGSALLKKIKVEGPNKDHDKIKMVLFFKAGDSTLEYKTEGKLSDWPQKDAEGKDCIYVLPIPELDEDSSILKQTTLDGVFNK